MCTEDYLVIYGRAKSLVIEPFDALPVQFLFDVKTPPMSQFPQSWPAGEIPA